VWEFLEEYGWESAGTRLALLQQEPPPTGDERWDTLLAALAEHLAAGHDAAPPPWAEFRAGQASDLLKRCRTTFGETGTLPLRVLGQPISDCSNLQP
jgi:hypothetical protein